MKLIDKDLLIKEIKERIQKINDTPHLTFTRIGCRSGYKDVLSFLDSLEMKEVDLDLEISLWANAIPEIRLDDVERIAKYFFELGLKAQKGGGE